MVAHELNYRVIGLVSLNDDAPGIVGTTSGAACHLFKHIEGAFCRAEVGKIDYSVGIDHGDKTHVAEIEAFCHHLSTHQDVGFMLGKFIDNVGVCIFATGGVEIHAQNTRVGKFSCDLIFDALGAVACDFDCRLMACRTYLWHGIHGTAVVALQEVAEAVIGEGHVAEVAFRDELTHTTVGAWRVSAAIMEEYRLAMVGKSFASEGNGVECKRTVYLAEFALTFEVKYIDLW